LAEWRHFSHILDMVWLYRSPIPVGERGQLVVHGDYILPAFSAGGGGERQHPVGEPYSIPILMDEYLSISLIIIFSNYTSQIFLRFVSVKTVLVACYHSPSHKCCAVIDCRGTFLIILQRPQVFQKTLIWRINILRNLHKLVLSTHES
jgi:hypothetical protein